jgi:hypothetical protein
MSSIATDEERHSRRYRHVAIVAVVGLAVVLAGCTVNYEATIGSDGSIEELSVEMDLGEQLYSQAQSQAEAEGYDSVAKYIFEGNSTNTESDFDKSQWENVEYSDDGESTVGITASGGSADMDESLTINVDDEAGEVEYIDTEGVSSGSQEGQGQDQFGEIEWTYTVNMPGEITETNGNQEGDTTVTWNNDDHGDLEEYRVVSKQSSGSGDGFGPGFGIMTGLAAVALIFGLGLARRARN